MFNHKSMFKMTGLVASALFCMPMLLNASTSANNAKNAKKMTAAKSSAKSAKYNNAYNWVLNWVRSSKERPTVTLVPSSKSMYDLLSKLLGLDRLSAKAEALMPKVQQKIKNIGDNRAELEKDADVKEFMELSLEGQRLSKRRDEIMEAALEMFTGAVSGMDPNVLVFVVGGNLSYNEDAADDNHILIQAQKLYTCCIEEAYANLKDKADVAKVEKTAGAKEAKNDNTQLHSSAHLKSDAKKVKK